MKLCDDEHWKSDEEEEADGAAGVNGYCACPPG